MLAAMEVHLNIRIYGHVQGVFFRHAAKKKACALGIRGFVRNEDRGSLYIEAEGEEEQLDEFVTWCRRGPHFASVETMAYTEAPSRGFSGFEITG